MLANMRFGRGDYDLLIASIEQRVLSKLQFIELINHLSLAVRG
jgi:hypothetical protein